MVFIPSWENPPDFLGASEAGARLNLSRQQILEQANEHAESLAAESALAHDRLSQQAAQRTQQVNQENAANALRTAALKQQGLLGFQRLQNESNSTSARDSLEKAKTDALTNKPVFANTGNGLFTIDPVTKQWTKVPGTSRPAPTKYENQPTYIPPVAAKDADITPASGGSWNPFNWDAGATPAVTNSPAISAAPGHWYNKRVPIAEPSDDDSAPQPAANALIPPAAPSPAPDTTAPPITATNPKTGEKMILQNGKWQPIPQQ